MAVTASTPNSPPDTRESSQSFNDMQKPTQAKQHDAPKRETFSIVLPRLDSSEKDMYTDLKLKVYDIVGEYQEGSKNFYYALLGDRYYHKLKAGALKQEYPDLVNDYERKKVKGLLPKFDPSGPDVHHYSRIRMTIKLKKNHVNASIFKRSVRDVVVDSEEGSPSDSEDEGEASEYDEEGTPVRLRRSSRTVSRQKRILLPYSPKKTRSYKPLIPRDSEESESEVEEIAAPTRRSTRVKANAKVAIIDEDYTDEDEGHDTDGYESSSTKSQARKPKKPIRGKASRPAYGNVRVVADLDFDSCSDEESAPLRTHRDTCEKCHRSPTHVLLEKERKKPKRKGKKQSEEDDEGDDQRLAALGGWVRCLKCPIASHWKCLNLAQRTEILKAALDRDTEQFNRTIVSTEDNNERSEGGEKKQSNRKPANRSGLDAYQTTEFICNYCIKGGICMGCEEVALKPDPLLDRAAPGKEVDVSDLNQAPPSTTEVSGSRELLFRCLTCKRLSHYSHLPVPPGVDEDVTTGVVDLALYYQNTNRWTCRDCSSYIYRVDKILAWRPYPPGAIETDDTPNYKSQLPREYLVKWQDRSYRRTQWVPHMWLLSTHMGKLLNFVQGKSPKVDLLETPIDEDKDCVEVSADHRRQGSVPPLTFGDVIEEPTMPTPPPDTGLESGANPDAQKKIPPAWKTVDRVLAILMWIPFKSKRAKRSTKGRRVESNTEDTEDDVDADAEAERAAAFELGEQPSGKYTTEMAQWEKMMKREMNEGDIDGVIWIFTKWKNLGYDESSWDSPPRPGELGYAAFQAGFRQFLAARNVHITKMSKSEAQRHDNRPKAEFKKKHVLRETPDLGQSAMLQLMPFQIDGVNWLCNNWWTHQHCILADEMGLGKTVQIVAFIGIITAKFQASPSLVVVPNSTITNWVREFERWAPHVRVVPYYGDAKSRDIIRRFELQHSTVKPGETGVKYHVLVTTYETLINQKEFGTIFNSVPRWETLVVDEGQRLKSDRSLTFRKLGELKTIHRIILTGTPLNNNIRELFNLMNFLDPDEWNDLKELEKEHEVLTEELVKSLHGRLRPYFLRRIKSEVLQLPPKNEVIVPVSMTPLQKEVYRSILSQNLEVLQSLTQPADTTFKKVSQGNMNNMLMQLRKCLQHPYLVSTEIEPKNLSSTEAHGKLIDASAKLLLLRVMLPKLRNRGHRVLLFSQFKIVLDIVEDFLDGEGIKHLRLDGDTPSMERQKGIDEFNRPGSDIFVYMLTTRAGGVGINLYTSDTVIIFDPDFNPHQDLQAIARAHRYGQQKPCLVFKLMVKNSAEDRIMQVGKKKLALDHVIVQKMDEDGPGEDVQSILTFGAQQLFQEREDDRGIIYTDADIDSLIEKTEKEGDQVEEHGSSMTFSFAKIWAADKDGLEEMAEVSPEVIEQGNSWAQTLQRIAGGREKAQAKAQEVTGRGAKRKAAAVFPQQQLQDISDSPQKSKSKKSKKGKAPDSDDSDVYMSSIHEFGDDTDATASVVTDDFADLGDTAIKKPKSIPGALPLSTIQNGNTEPCGLCGSSHRPGACYMTDTSENLAEFRLAILTNANGEHLETRRAAIQAIDETLVKRGDLSLIHGQPLYIVTSHNDPPLRKKAKKDKSATSARADKHKSQTTTGKVGSSTAAAPSWTNAVAGSSKRAPSPVNGEPPAKKAKSSTPPNCTVCGISAHDINDCPTVLDGPASVMKAMKRLETDAPNANNDSTLTELKKILKQQRRRLIATAS